MFYSSYESLSEEEIERVQAKLARMIVTFLDLLHLLIARNRDILLTVVWLVNTEVVTILLLRLVRFRGTLQGHPQ